jgi:multicomponent Na+:H+ antiporter subunit G
MDVIANALTVLALLASLFFFASGAIGLIRLPDTLSRIHPLSKADSIALGLVAIGLLPQAGSIVVGAKIIFVWVLVQISAGAITQLMARIALAEARPDEGQTKIEDSEHGGMR